MIVLILLVLGKQQERARVDGPYIHMKTWNKLLAFYWLSLNRCEHLGSKTVAETYFSLSLFL